MYGITTSETISHELLTTYHRWNQYIAHIWYNLFYYSELPIDGVVVEIAPGTSNKIALALKKLDFCGDVYIVEPYQEALEQIAEQYRQYLPNANIIPVQKTLEQCQSSLPNQIDYIVANHALDDLLIADGDACNLQALFSWVKSDQLVVQTNFQKHWQSLTRDTNRLERKVIQIKKQWLSLLNNKRPQKVIMSQYASLLLQQHGLDSLNLQASALLHDLIEDLQSCFKFDSNLQTLLNANKHYNFPLIQTNVLDANHWCLGYLVTT